MPESRDVTVRAATLGDVTGMARVFVDTFRSAHHGQVPEDLLLERTYETSARGWDRTLREIGATDDPDEHVLVAVDRAGEIVGVAMGGPARPWAADDSSRVRCPTGECYALYVDVGRQRNGVGRALLTALAAFLGTHGVRRLLVGVLAANQPARAFYERAGGVLLGGREVDDSGELLDEVVYVWDDLTSLLDDRGR